MSSYPRSSWAEVDALHSHDCVCIMVYITDASLKTVQATYAALCNTSHNIRLFTFL